MYKCSSPVLLIGFNRPNYIKKAIEALRKVKPSKLYFAVDGPRSDSEAEKVLQTQECIKLIDWECNINTLFREKNLGCKYGVASAIDWVFQNEDFAIIIEDDIIAMPDFFEMCDLLGKKYRDTENIYMISGTNYNPDVHHQHSYIYTQNYTIWGWATWKRCWQNYDVEMYGWNDQKNRDAIRKCSPSWIQWQYWKRNLNNLSSDYVDTWDIQWVYHCLINSGLAVTATTNLITNIGVDGVHSQEKTISHFMETQPLNHSKGGPEHMIVDPVYDTKIRNTIYRKLIILDFLKKPIRPFYKRIKGLF